MSDWFVEALRPAMASLGLSEAFVGLVVVVIARNAVENVAGIQQSLRNRPDLAISLTQNSSLQVAIALTPVLMLASLVIAPVPMTLILAPTLLVGLGLTAVLGALVVFDGESTWLEGLMLFGLYAIVAASVGTVRRRRRGRGRPPALVPCTLRHENRGEPWRPGRTNVPGASRVETDMGPLRKARVLFPGRPHRGLTLSPSDAEDGGATRSHRAVDAPREPVEGWYGADFVPRLVDWPWRRARPG